jgi:phosphotransferase system  glucose/maltose/N-acetylglucosamine-specific IIC component
VGVWAKVSEEKKRANAANMGSIFLMCFLSGVTS